jgi:hypothetical protein
MFYIQQQRHMANRWPKEISNVGACAKFGLLMLKAPEGDENKLYRKKLSIRIVLYLVTQWYKRGLLAKEWYDMFRQASKADDLADAFLMTYMEELRRRKYPVKWLAIELLFTFLVSEPPFRSDSKCPLKFTALGRTKFNAYIKAQEKQKLRAIMEKNARLVGRQKRKNETNEQYLAQAKKQKLLPFNNPAPPPPPSPALVPAFPTCLSVAANYAAQAAQRKERGPINDPTPTPRLHASETNPFGRTTLVAKRTIDVTAEDESDDDSKEDKEYQEACILRIELDDDKEEEE